MKHYLIVIMTRSSVWVPNGLAQNGFGPLWRMIQPRMIRPTSLKLTHNAMKEYTEKGSRCKEYARGRTIGNFTRIKYWINYPRNVEFSGFRIQLEYWMVSRCLAGTQHYLVAKSKLDSLASWPCTGGHLCESTRRHKSVNILWYQH